MIPANNDLRHRTKRFPLAMICTFTAALLLAAGCDTEPRLDKGKFADLNAASQDLKAAFRSGDRCDIPESVLQRLDRGIESLKDRTASKAERDLLTGYARLVTIARDGLFLCRSRDHLTRFQYLPKGRIYVTQELDPIVERYDLATETHIYKSTGAKWKSISGDSIGVIWEKAEALMQSIEVLLKYG